VRRAEPEARFCLITGRVRLVRIGGIEEPTMRFSNNGEKSWMNEGPIAVPAVRPHLTVVRNRQSHACRLSETQNYVT
jgi:hypothetical protein